jgi:hypothetical protein
MKKIITSTNTPEILIYQNEDGKIKLEVRFEDDNIWLSQQLMAELFGTTKQNVGWHLRNIFNEGELDSEAVVKESFTTASDGKQYRVMFYNLDVIISVGYRIKSLTATRFRIWATQKLKEYLIKGFVLDDERLKGNNTLVDYFDELLARIRDIRASEKRAYLRIREIFALAVDYNPQCEAAQVFYATMQNKMHFAATGKTAAELVATRANANIVNMGLTNWKGSVVRKGDIAIAKNYLDAKEIDILNRIVNMFLEQAEFRILRKQQIYTRHWENNLNKFLLDNDLPILEGVGNISHFEATAIAEENYLVFEEKRRAEKEANAEDRYVEELTTTSKLVAAKRKKK